jgi:hypothetical protein
MEKSNRKQKIGLWFRLPGQRDPISKIIIAKRSGGMAQEVERLPSKCKILNSKLSTAK